MRNTVDFWRSDSHPHRYTSPFGGEDYVLLLVICDASITDEEQKTISRRIVDTGCRYALAYGHKCSSWDDSIDLAYIDAGEDPQRFVMTTWHDDESIEDVIDFWWRNTTFEDYVPTRFGVFLIGHDQELEDAILGRVDYHQTKETEQGGAPDG